MRAFRVNYSGCWIENNFESERRKIWTVQYIKYIKSCHPIFTEINVILFYEYFVS